MGRRSNAEINAALEAAAAPKVYDLATNRKGEKFTEKDFKDLSLDRFLMFPQDAYWTAEFDQQHGQAQIITYGKDGKQLNIYALNLSPDFLAQLRKQEEDQEREQQETAKAVFPKLVELAQTHSQQKFDGKDWDANSLSSFVTWRKFPPGGHWIIKRLDKGVEVEIFDANSETLDKAYLRESDYVS